MLVVTGAIIGLAPAVRLMRSDMKTLMNESSRSASAGRGTTRWLMAMTVAEVALAIMLVAGAGWLVRGFANLRNTDAGFVTDKRLVFDATVPRQRDSRRPKPLLQAQLDLVAALKSIHGVTNVGLVSAYPMIGRLENSLLAQFHGEPFDAANPPGTRQRIVRPGTVRGDGHAHHQGSRLRIGRQPDDVPVAIVNTHFVDRYLKGRDPIGAQFSAGYPTPDPKQRGDGRRRGRATCGRSRSPNARRPRIYTPLTQFEFRFSARDRRRGHVAI